MKEIDNTPIEDLNIDWGDPDGTGRKAKSLEQVQKFIKEKMKTLIEKTSELDSKTTDIQLGVKSLKSIVGQSRWYDCEKDDVQMWVNTSNGKVNGKDDTLWAFVIPLTEGIPLYCYGNAVTVAVFSEYPKVGDMSLELPSSAVNPITIMPKSNHRYAMFTVYSRIPMVYIKEGLAKKLSDIDYALAYGENLTAEMIDGYYRINNSTITIGSTPLSVRKEISVKEGDIYNLKGSGHVSDMHMAIFTDDDNLVKGGVKYPYPNDGIINESVEVPTGATKLFFSSKSISDLYLGKIEGFIDVQKELKDMNKRFDITEKVLDVIEVSSKNLYDGRYIDRGLVSTSGLLNYADGYAVTEPIPIQPNHYYYLSNRHYSVTTSIRCLTADGEVLKVLAAKTGMTGNYFYLPKEDGNGNQVNGQFKTPEGAVSVQFIIKSPNTSVNNWNEVMLEDVGDVYDPTFEPSPYEPYNLKAYIKEEALPEEVIENITGQNKRKAPRILLIGSSHGMNTISQLPWMFYRNGYDEVYVGNVYLGSFKLQELAQRVMLNKTLSYQAFKDGGWGKDKGSLTMGGLLNKEWDVIILQRSADTCKQWGVAESTSFGYVVDYITKHVKDNGLVTPRILFNSGFADGKADTTEQIMTTALQCKEEYGVEIIPNAYAMANARNTWLKEIGTTGYLCYDNQHLDYGIGCWVASACVYEAVMRPLGESVECVSAYGTLAEQSIFTAAAIESTYTEPTEATMRIAKDCVLAAFNENALNEELQSKYQFKNRVYVFPGWASIEGTDVDTKCVADNGSYNITFTIWNGSYFDDSVDSPVIVKMGDTDITDIAYTQNEDSRGGSIGISNIIDNVYIIIMTTRNPINPPA